MSLRFFLILVYIFCAQFTQAGKIDSLKQALNSKSDTGRVHTLLELTYNYRRTDIDSAYFYLQQANKLLSAIKENFNSSAINRCQAYYYQQKGLVNQMTDQYDSAHNSYNEAYEIYKRQGLVQKQSQILINLGTLHEETGNFSKALEAYYALLSLTDSASLKLEKSRVLINIGVIYLNQQKYKKALEYFGKAIPLKKEVKDKQGEALAYNNIGIAYYYLSEYDKVLENFKRSLNIYRQINDLRSQALPYFNIAEIYYEQRELKEALYYYKKSYEIERQLNNMSDQAVSLMAIGNVYIDLKKFTDAIRVQQEAVNILSEIGAKHELANALLQLSYSYEVLGNYKKALEKYKAHKHIKDSVFNLRKEAQIAKIQEQYESKQKDQQIALLQKQNRLAELENKQKQAQINSRQRIAVLSLLVAALGLFALVMIYRLYRQKKLSNQMLELKNGAIQRKNDEIIEVVQKLENNLKGRREFYRIILSELRVPLVSISGFARLISLQPNNESLQKYIAQLQKSARVLIRVLENFTVATKLETGDFKLNREGVDINEIAKHLLKHFEPLAVQRKVELDYHIDDSCPRVLDLDPVRYFQLLSNLTDNAIRRVLPGGKVSTIFYYEKPNLLKVKVKDTGVEISDSYKEDLYTQFQEKDDLVSNTVRFGLGLSLVKSIIDAYDGSIFIDGNDAGENEMTVALPTEVVSNSSFSFSAHEQDLSENNLLTGKILIADNKEEISDEVDEALAAYSKGLTVEHVNEKEEAITLLDNKDFDICIVNIPAQEKELAEYWEAFKKVVGSRNKSTVFIGVSDNISQGFLQASNKHGISGVLKKPIEVYKLLVEIERFVCVDPGLGLTIATNCTNKNQIVNSQVEVGNEQPHSNKVEQNLTILNSAIRQKDWKTVMEQINQLGSGSNAHLTRDVLQYLNVIEKECVTTRNVDVMLHALELFQKKRNKNMFG